IVERSYQFHEGAHAGPAAGLVGSEWLARASRPQAREKPSAPVRGELPPLLWRQAGRMPVLGVRGRDRHLARLARESVSQGGRKLEAEVIHGRGLSRSLPTGIY